MALTVTQLSADGLGELDGDYATLVANFNPTYKCAATGPDLPDKEWLRACVVEDPAHHYVAVARDGDVVGLVVVHVASQMIVWLVPVGNYAGGVTVIAGALCQWVADVVGVAQGNVDNAAVRALWTAHDTQFQTDASADPYITWGE